jgi:uncharacterized protein YgiM (DUF1202 family)
VLIGGILLFVFCSVGAAALYAFGRLQSSRSVPFAPVAAPIAGPVESPRPREDDEWDRTPDEEAGVPRWLRASVRADRFWTPQARKPERALYERGPVAFLEVPRNAARMVVRSDVTLLDGPNESYAAIVGRLHSGDEVLVVLMDRDWAEVRAANGATGWLPSTGLAGTPGAPQPADPLEAEGTGEKPSRGRPARKRRAAPS